MLSKVSDRGCSEIVTALRWAEGICFHNFNSVSDKILKFVEGSCLNPVCLVTDSELGATEQSCLPAPDLESDAETHFIKLVLEVFLQFFPPATISKFCWIFFVFYKFLQHHEQVLTLHTHGSFSWGVCWQEQWFWSRCCWVFTMFMWASVWNQSA